MEQERLTDLEQTGSCRAEPDAHREPIGGMKSPGTGRHRPRDFGPSGLRAAVEIYGGRPGHRRRRCANTLDPVDEPLRVAIAGKIKAGKSTLLNALVGEHIAPTDSGECTRVVTWYEHGVARGSGCTPTDGPARALPVRRVDGSSS